MRECNQLSVSSGRSQATNVIAFPVPGCGVQTVSGRNKRKKVRCSREPNHSGWHHDALMVESWPRLEGEE